MGLFWEKGYEAAALPYLLEAMGLTRGSFYKAFGSKHAVYLGALRLYRDKIVNAAVHLLETGAPEEGHARIRRLFNAQVAIMTGPHARRGCFLCRAAIDRAPHDGETERLVLAMTAQLELAFGRARMMSSPQARLAAATLRKAGAPLAAAYFAIQVMRNAGANAKTIKAIAKGAADLLEDGGQ